MGNRVFSNVPFIVVPDESMSFPKFDYSISLVLGLPVIVRLERVTFDQSTSSELMYIEPSRGIALEDTANLITSGWEMVALVHLDGNNPRRRMHLDSRLRTRGRQKT